jgi:hypothetical protein
MRRLLAAVSPAIQAVAKEAGATIQWSDRWGSAPITRPRSPLAGKSKFRSFPGPASGYGASHLDGSEPGRTRPGSQIRVANNASVAKSRRRGCGLRSCRKDVKTRPAAPRTTKPTLRGATMKHT